MKKVYDGYLLAGYTRAVRELGIDVGENVEQELTMERLLLTCDTRIPGNAIGYVSDLCNDQSTRAIKLDRIRMLSRYIEFSGPRTQDDVMDEKIDH